MREKYVYTRLSRWQGKKKVGVFTSTLDWNELSDYWRWSKKYLRTYVLDDEEGILVKYVKSERKFAARAGSFVGASGTQNMFHFDAYPSTKYYEVMPNGDYRLLSKEEVQQLRDQNENA